MMSLGPTNQTAASIEKKLAAFGVTAEDCAFFAKAGKPLTDVLTELQALKAPPRYPASVSPALLENGFMLPLGVRDMQKLLQYFQDHVLGQDLEFVVPAAGAASRQTQLLLTILNHPDLASAATPRDVFAKADARVKELEQEKRLDEARKADLKSLKEVQGCVWRFWTEGICDRRYAFWEDLRDVMAAKGQSLENAIRCDDIKNVARFIAEREGLGYAYAPKLLMRLHAYQHPDGTRECRLALEEHLRTAAQLFAGAARLRQHFIVSPEHEDAAREHLEKIWQKPGFVECLKGLGFDRGNVEVTWSQQAPYTDSVALDISSGKMARNGDGTPLLRRAGHGSLLPNYSQLRCPGLWTQNVDNVLYDNPQIKRLVIMYKQTMAALAMQLEKEAHDYIRRLVDTVKDDQPNLSLNAQVLRFLDKELLTEILPGAFASKSPQEVSRMLIDVLDRPIVVAGYVPLEMGQAGGGPFVIETELGGVRVNKVNTLEQAEFPGGAENTTFRNGAFFNPVDIFISRRRYDNSYFDMEVCIDPSRFFISSKTDAAGRTVKAYERPGLWNGSLAQALQASIAIPASVFSAIKDMAGKESFLAPLHHRYDDPVLVTLDFQRGVVDEGFREFLEDRLRAG